MGWTAWTWLVGLLLTASILRPGLGQEDEMNEVEVPATQLESTVVSDMLRIVDHKFDTLTTRISALERAVSGLQFFSIRQFRQLSANIQETQNDFDNVHKKIGQLEVDGRGLKISMSLLGRNVGDLKSTASGILGELESSVLYVNENVDKQAQALKQQLQESAKQTERLVETRLAKHAEEAKAKKKQEVNKPLNCTVDFTDLAERIDVRFAEFKQQTYVHCAKLIHDARSEQADEKRDVEEKSHRLSTDADYAEPGPAAFSAPPEVNYYKNKKEQHQRKKLVSKEKNASGRYEENETSYGEEYDDRIMQFLFNMTTSVLQATSYFRHSGRMMERILSNTDVLVEKQTSVKRDLGIVKASLSNQNMTHGPDKARLLPRAPADPREVRQAQEGVAKVYSPLWAAGNLKECKLSASMLKGLQTMAQNGSQLLEVLTDLAQMSSMSLAKVTTSLQSQVQRVENFHTRLSSTILAKFKELQSAPIASIKNNTQRLFKLVEKVSSNTGWLPVMLRDVQQLGNMVNQSLFVSSSNSGLLQKIHRLQTATKESAYSGQEKALDNRIARVPPPAKNEIPDGNGNSPDTDTASVSESYTDFVLDRESLEVIYKTSRQLNRIMPALTKLLAEPDPLITLVGGKHADEGRLEIYNQGQWGTICHVDLSHQEADAVCRHLGFAGGISAGAGNFGPGTGIAWKLNGSCLAPTATCPIVTQLEDLSQCDHARDVALICDHMLRISSGNDTVNNKIGRLEIHNKGLWLPICGEGWSGYSARVACQQMGFADGREVEQGAWPGGVNSTWLSQVACDGSESRLDACPNHGWVDTCLRNVPAGVRCL